MWAVNRISPTFFVVVLIATGSVLPLNQALTVSSIKMTSTPSVSTAVEIPLERLADHATSYAAAHGLQVEKRTSKGDGVAGASTYQCAPISLLPNAYPGSAFHRAKILAEPFNLLVDRISRDGEFLDETLGGEGGVAEADPYTGKLLRLYKDIYANEGEHGKFARSADRLGIHRSDYMLHSKENGQCQLKQVELNTIASSFAGLAVNVAKLHRHLVARFGDEVKDFLDSNKEAVMGGVDQGDHVEEEEGVPDNPALESIPEAINAAHERYVDRFLDGGKGNGPGPVVLFVVQEGETNTVDQRMLEFRLWSNHAVPVVRMSLSRAHTDLEMNESTGALTIKGTGTLSSREVSVVYYRAGYAPTDYPSGYSGIEWQSRESIERSRATKCPSLGYHLAGTKKVQQELARPGTLERFLPHPDERTMVVGMRRAFAGLYSLGDDANEQDLGAVRDALAGGEGRYVLKPQREGGGYNYYGQHLAKKLSDNVESSDENLELGGALAEFILMDRLFPPRQTAILLRAGTVEGSGESISELGCFGALVTTHNGKVLHNEYAGFLLRTKFSNVDEGGVASGFATLSSPYLC